MSTANTGENIVVDTIELGDVRITRVVEWHSPIAPAAVVFPSSTEQMWRSNQDWLAPHFWDPETTFFKAYTQTWVLRSGGRTILVDTGVGNDKERPYMRVWSHLDTDFLSRLAAAGVEPEDVDIVVNTHVHADHVGWNTRLVDREWVPTFPSAKYLIARADFEFWNPVNGYPKRGSLGGISGALGNQNMFLQFMEPECEACLSEDEPAAARQRRRFLERAADTNALVLPAHLPGPGGALVRREGSAFAIEHWAPFSPVA
ncbi:MBL fold metallo-hydrolase [Nocardia sp. NPDC051787]|uniref:MBL fold metallo-hydrolase n=1 Tax=Nocardia sp. NPDC051787 TaxID=3155415 RepID=UPI003429F44F